MNDPLNVSSLPSPAPELEPSRLVEKERIKQKLLEAEEREYVDESSTFESEYAIAPEGVPVSTLPHTAHTYSIPKNPLELIADAITHIDAKHRVEVQGPFGKITFRAIHVSTNDHGLAFIIHKDQMSWEPNVGQKLQIRCDGQSHNVVYAGGYFTFQQMPFTFLSFIKYSEDGRGRDDGEEWES